MQGVYGAWVNTDGFTVGEAKEVWAGMRIFEIALQAGTVRHYVWSSLDYALRVSSEQSTFSIEPEDSLAVTFTQEGNYDPQYRCEHYDGKARVADWMRSQPSVTGRDGMSWSIITSGPYMDMLFNVCMMHRPTRMALSD